ncbi:hypothetical protein KR032_006869 [Drosophila birchii]|nr:hypothetical protein KR032_006869 [Drosophila birchii]
MQYISLLIQRHLQVDHLESLSHGQLEKIYQEFAVPQPRRQPRNRPTAIDSPTREVEHLTQRIKMATWLGQKSPMPGEQSSPDYKNKPIKMDLS